jgi:hypothetical protein
MSYTAENIIQELLLTEGLGDQKIVELSYKIIKKLEEHGYKLERENYANRT